MKAIVRGLWRGEYSSYIYGYCSCGREVQHSDIKIDETWPMCGAKLEWKIDDKSLWIHGKNH